MLPGTLPREGKGPRIPPSTAVSDPPPNDLFRTGDTGLFAVQDPEVAFEDVFPAGTAFALIEGRLGPAESKTSQVFHFEHLLIRRFQDNLHCFLHHRRGNLGGFYSLLPVGKKILSCPARPGIPATPKHE